MGLLTLGRSEHTDPEKSFHVHENRNSSKDLSSDRQARNCKKRGKGRKDMKQKKSRPREQAEKSRVKKTRKHT